MTLTLEELVEALDNVADNHGDAYDYNVQRTNAQKETGSGRWIKVHEDEQLGWTLYRNGPYYIVERGLVNVLYKAKPKTQGKLF
jgi:hypothetical protein